MLIVKVVYFRVLGLSGVVVVDRLESSVVFSVISCSSSARVGCVWRCSGRCTCRVKVRGKLVIMEGKWE